MDTRDKRRRAAGLGLLGACAVAALALVGWALHGGGRTGTGQTATDVQAGPAPVAAAPRPVETQDEIAREVSASLESWRRAVLNRDPDAVIRLDDLFRREPARYVDGLVASARTEGNERVRAFSTRVLGKLKKVELAGVFQQLLSDPSPYVRQNAAWGLGELAADQDGGRDAAKRALAELRHVRATDPAADTRAAARGALERLE